jgi:hypothetical protein
MRVLVNALINAVYVYLAFAALIVLFDDPPILHDQYPWLAIIPPAAIAPVRVGAVLFLALITWYFVLLALYPFVAFLLPTDSGSSPTIATAPTPQTTKKQTNRATVAGFWLGIASMFVYPLGIIPLLGIIFSCIGIANFDESIHKNRWMAGIGLALSLVYMLMNAILNGHFDRV